MDEIWKNIYNYENYQVSNLGRVRSLNFNRTNQTKILKTHVGKNGYEQVCLSKNNIKKTFTVHRLVAKAFIPNPNNLPYIDHIDTNRLNNNVINLRWCTKEENQNNPFTIKHFSIAKKGFKHSTETINQIKKKHEKPIIQYTKDMVFVKKWDSAKKVFDELGYNWGNIRKCCLGLRKSAYGYIWKEVS